MNNNVFNQILVSHVITLHGVTFRQRPHQYKCYVTRFFFFWFGCFFPALGMKLPVRGFINIIRETVAGNYVDVMACLQLKILFVSSSIERCFCR